MEFHTEKERRQHPQVSLIPANIWRHYFCKKISNSEIALMKSKPHKIRFSSMKWRPYSVCLCILYGHPKITAFEFLALLDKKRATLKYTIEAAIITNRKDIIHLIAQRHKNDLQYILEAEAFEVIREAARVGSLSSIKYVISLYAGSVSVMLRAQLFEVFRCSCMRSTFKCKLFDYLLSLAPELEEEVISFYNFCLFRNAAKYGNIAMIHRLISLTPNKIEYMLSSENYGIFSEAAIEGRLKVLKLLFSFIPEKIVSVVCSNQYKIIKDAALFGRIKVINYLFNVIPNEIHNVLTSNNYRIFYDAIQFGRINTFNYLLKKLTSDQINEMVKAQFNEAFQSASALGSDKALLRLKIIAPSMLQQMIASDNYAAFREAQNLRVLNLLVKWAPDKVHEMVCADDFYAFRCAARSRGLEILKYLFKLYPSQRMIAAKAYEAFSEAAASGNLSTVKYIISKSHPDSLYNMLMAEKCRALCEAISNSHFFVVKYLLKIAGNRATSMLVKNDFLACKKIRDARILKLILSLIPEHQEQIIGANNFDIFLDAAICSQMDVLKHLVKVAPDKVQAMISAQDFLTFSRSVYINRDLEVLHYLLQLVPDKLEQMLNVETLCSAVSTESILMFEFIKNLIPNRLKELICADNCKVFRASVDAGNLHVVKILFKYAPKHITAMMELDNELLQMVIRKRHLDVLDFMLSCSSKLLFKEIFIYPEEPFGLYVNYWQRKAATLAEETLLHDISMVFFENPSQLSGSTQCEIINGFITLGYFSIAKTLMIKFWKNVQAYEFNLLIEILIRASYYPNKISEILGFLVDFLHVKPSKLSLLLSRISYDDLPLNYMGQFNQPKINFRTPGAN